MEIRFSTAVLAGRARLRYGLALAPIQSGLAAAAVSLLLAMPCFPRPIKAAAKVKPAEFRYVSGTEDLPEDCRGELEVTPARLVYSCPAGSVQIPYASIMVMEYRSRVSRKLRPMNLPWVFQPWGLRRKTNRFFTIVYLQQGSKHALVLDVPPAAMRPYFAEIDLRAGRRVQVESHEKYDY